MVRIFLILAVMVVCAAPVPALARLGSCGDLDEDGIEDAYDIAERVDYYYDMISDIERACAVAERFEDWEKAHKELFRGDRALRKKKRGLIRDIDEALEEIGGDLRMLMGWLYVDVDGAVNEAKRIARIKIAKRSLKAQRKILNERVNQMEALIQ